MASYETKDIRNVALAGHGDSGKTTLAEALLFAAGMIPRQGVVTDGTTVSDYDSDEKDRGHSIDTAVLHIDWNGRRLNLLDTPGRPEFLGKAFEAMGAVETVAIVVNASSGLGVSSRRAWLEAERLGLGRIVIVNKMDHDNLDPPALLASLREAFGDKLIPADLPIGHGAAFGGVVPTLNPPDDVPPDMADEVAEVHEQIMEAVIEADDQLLERYLGGEEISPDELGNGVATAIRKGTLVPVLYASATKASGVKKLLDFLCRAVPSPEGVINRTVYSGIEGDEVVEKKSDSPFLAQVFKLMTDDYVGKISFLRVFAGSLKAESSVYNPQMQAMEKVKEVSVMQGKDPSPVPVLVAGDIGTVIKIEHLHLGDSLCDESEKCRVAHPRFPKPMVEVAVVAKSRGDEGKIGTALGRLAAEDPTFVYERRAETRQLVVAGMSALHLNVVLSRLKNRFHVEVDTMPPRIAYRETISANGDSKYRHKKQSGGAGQFAEVHLRVSPQERGVGFEFENAVVGGTIPGQYIPSCEKGIRGVLETGAVAGYPMVDIKATVYDGKHHPVDSKDIAFQIAARNAFKEAVRAAKPVLLEPVMEVEILLPPEKMGDITGDLNSRRGRIMGMDMVAGMQVIKAQVPQAELLSYAADLQSMTGGEGSYSVEFSHYEPVPSHLADRIISAAAKEREEED